VSFGAARFAQAVSGRLVDRIYRFEQDMLRVSLWGHSFANPIGLAAGMDKNARLIDFWPHLGFGFAEIGSVTYRPSRGNPKPRAFRLEEDEALINRMGLNNQGAERIARRIGDRGMYHPFPLGINLAKTHDPGIVGQAAIDDYVESFRLLAPAANYVALNISCPNTSEGKTFEDPESLDRLLAAILGARKEVNPRVPILVKLSPPLSDRVVFDSLTDELIQICTSHGVSGFVATNTASDRSGLATPPELLERIGPGGLSGKPIERRSTRLVRYLYERSNGTVPIVGVGGVDSGASAYEKIRAGATLVQVYTGLIYRGPSLIKTIKQQLVELLREDGYSSVLQAVGQG
jgi:dihydroorotate dehydrogenase